MNSKLVILSAWFQGLWFLAVVGREPCQWLLTALLLFTVFNQWFNTRPQWPWLLLAIPGIAMDYLLFTANIFDFENHQFPLWLALLWVAFIWYFLQLSPVLKKLPFYLVGLIGAIAGPISYWAGLLLSAVQWPSGLAHTLIILALCWATFLSLTQWVLTSQTQTPYVKK